MLDSYSTNNINYGTKTFGNETFYYRKVDSTNNVAVEKAKNGAPEGSIIIADEQTAGRGRFNRLWHSPVNQGLWFSMVLRPKVEPIRMSQLTIVTAVALAEAVYNLYKIELGIKWPNDLLLKGKKVCGILSEGSVEKDKVAYVVVGVGINIYLDVDNNIPGLGFAGALESESGCKVDRKELLREILQRMEIWYEIWERVGFSSIKSAWKEKNVTIGERVEVDSYGEFFSGEAIDMDDGGGLVVKGDNGDIQSFNSGEVTLKRKKY